MRRPVQETPKLPSITRSRNALERYADDLAKRLTQLFQSYGFVINNLPVREFAELSVSPVPANGTGASWNHALEVEPKHFSVELICTTAELTFEVGDIVSEGISGIGVAKQGTDVFNDASYTIGSTGVTILSENTGVVGTITNANWDLRLRAYA